MWKNSKRIREYYEQLWCSPFLVAMCLACLLLVGCGASEPIDNEAPVQTVRDFVAAWEARDTSQILSLVEPAEWRDEISPEVRSYTGLLAALEFENPTYTLVENTGENAQVQFQSLVRYTLQDQRSGEVEIDVILELVKVEKNWYLQNLDLTNAGQPTP